MPQPSRLSLPTRSMSLIIINTAISLPLCPRAGCERGDRRVQTERKRYSAREADALVSFNALRHVLKERAPSLRTLDVAAEKNLSVLCT